MDERVYILEPLPHRMQNLTSCRSVLVIFFFCKREVLQVVCIIFFVKEHSRAYNFVGNIIPKVMRVNAVV